MASDGRWVGLRRHELSYRAMRRRIVFRVHDGVVPNVKKWHWRPVWTRSRRREWSCSKPLRSGECCAGRHHDAPSPVHPRPDVRCAGPGPPRVEVIDIEVSLAAHILTADEPKGLARNDTADLKEAKELLDELS